VVLQYKMDKVLLIILVLLVVLVVD